MVGSLQDGPPATWYSQPSETPSPGGWASLVIPSFVLPIRSGKGEGMALLWLGYETSWLPSVNRFSFLVSWPHALLKQAAYWRGPCNKEPTGGFGQEPARNWSFNSLEEVNPTSSHEGLRVDLFPALSSDVSLGLVDRLITAIPIPIPLSCTFSWCDSPCGIFYLHSLQCVP